MSESEATAPAEADTGTSPVKNNVTSIEPARARRARQKFELEKLLQDIDLIETFDLELSAMEIIEAERLLDRAAALTPAHDATICEAIVKHFNSHPSEIPALKATIKEIRQASRSLTNPKPEKVRNAKRQDFYDLFETHLGPLRRDIFSGDLMRLGEDGFWVPAENYIEVVASETAVFEEEGVCKFKRGDLMPHFKAYEQSKPLELICSIPEWDGKDRIRELAKALILDGSQEGFTAETVEDFIKAWLAGVFRRMDDPRFQNPVLILIGPQEIGKDTLTDTMTDGLGQWAGHLEITGNHKDDYGQLSRALVYRIGEFDKLAQTDQARLKDMIFRDKTGLRDAYERKARARKVRCSFIASTNNHDIYKDSSGHRRYWPLNLESIKKGEYPQSAEDRGQIVAQAKSLAALKHEPSPESRKLMAAFLQERTPQSIEEELADHWCECVEAWMSSGSDAGLACEIRERYWISLSEARAAGIVKQMMDHHRITERYLCSKLTSLGMRRRNSKHKGYLISRVLPQKEVASGTTSGTENPKSIEPVIF